MPELKPRLTREGEVLVVDLAGIGKTAFDEALPKVKAIEGRRWNPDRKVWEFMAKPLTAHRLIHQVGAQPSAEVLGWVRAEMAKAADEVTTKLPKAGALRWRHAGILLEHQRDAVDFLVKHPRAIVADDMGLGKTLEAIGVVQETDEVGRLRSGPRLVIAPASLAGRWADELRYGPRHPETREPLVPDWYVGPVFIIPGNKPAPRRHKLLMEAAAVPGAWIIVTWEQVRAQKLETGRAKPKYRWTLKEPAFAEIPWAAVIADEAHRAKNPNAQQTRGLWQIHAPIKLALTGTPILNSPDELWPLLAWLYPESYAWHHQGDKVGYGEFFENYVEYSEGQHGKVITGVKNADALRFELADKLVRRTKGQVLDLPPKIRTTIPVRLGTKQEKAYREAEHGLWVEIEQALEFATPERRARITAALEAGDAYRLTLLIPNAAARVVRLQQILESPALLGGEDASAKLDTAAEIIADHPEKQFVVFTKFRVTTGLLASRLEKPGSPRRGKVATITGDTPPEQRTAIVAAFQAGEIEVLVATIAAGGVGLTLTAADTAIFTTRDWVPAINEQAEDRLHRIGQGSSVQILILETPDSVDDGRVAPKNRLKELIVGSVVTQDYVQHDRKEAA